MNKLSELQAELGMKVFVARDIMAELRRDMVVAKLDRDRAEKEFGDLVGEGSWDVDDATLVVTVDGGMNSGYLIKWKDGKGPGQ